MSWVLPIYYLTLAVLALYGVHRLVLVVAFLRRRRGARDAPPAPAEWPRVTVQLPIFNEMYVAERLVAAVAELDYPRDRLEIQVLDDSTDETRALVARQVAALRRTGIDVHHLVRDERTGFKAGALAAGLERAKGDLLAVFDADFVPARDFLRRAVPWFSDPAVGMVQARWEHLNRDFSLLTRVQAILLDGHFWIEHTARHVSGCFFNFNGTAGVWRRQAIVDAGGWQHDTLTEDLDLSYRSQLAGWRFVYLPELAVPAELPAEIAGFKSQQRRWAQGSVQTGRKLLGTILRAEVPWRIKLEAFVHLTNNGSYPLMVLLSLLVFPAMLLRRGAAAETILFVDLPLFLAATVSVVLFYAVSQHAGGGRWRRRLWQLPAVMGIGIGLALNNSRAVVTGLWQRGGVFHRTPKYRIEKKGDRWRDKRYLLGRDPFFALEVALALYFVAVCAIAVRLGMWLSLPFLYLFLQGYGTMAVLAWLDDRRGAQRTSRLAYLATSLRRPTPSK